MCQRKKNQRKRVKQKIKIFLTKYKKLFSIADCKCKIDKYKLKLSRKVPKIKRDFLNKKRSQWKVIYRVLDKIEIKGMIRRNKGIMLFSQTGYFATLKTFFLATVFDKRKRICVR